jgi:hypothetical protein
MKLPSGEYISWTCGNLWPKPSISAAKSAPRLYTDKMKIAIEPRSQCSPAHVAREQHTQAQDSRFRDCCLHPSTFGLGTGYREETCVFEAPNKIEEKQQSQILPIKASVDEHAKKRNIQSARPSLSVASVSTRFWYRYSTGGRAGWRGTGTRAYQRSSCTSLYVNV